MLSSLLERENLADQLASISLSKSKSKAEPTERYPDEPLLKANTKRFVLFPIQWNDLWTAYKDAEAKFWGAEEIKLTADADDWDSPKLDKPAKDLILRMLTLLASEPSLYGQDLTESVLQGFSEAVQVLESRCMYGYMMFSRNIYRELFSLCLEVYAAGFDDRKRLFEEVRDSTPAHKATAEWLQSYAMDEERSFAERNVALACWHAVHRTGALALLLHLTAPGPSGPSIGTPKKSSSGHPKIHALPGLVHGLQKIAPDFDRYLHYDALIQSHLTRHADEDFAKECVRIAVENEIASFSAIYNMAGSAPLAFALPLPQLSAFETHIKSRGDAVLVNLGYHAIYKVESPFTWLAAAMTEEGAAPAPSLSTPNKPKTPKAANVAAGSPASAMLPPTPASARKDMNVFTLDADF